MIKNIPTVDFSERPFVLIWEVTRACALACQHCRATAQPRAHPLELSTEEGMRLIDQAVRARPEIFILTGGDPVMRRDLVTLVRYATDQGLRVSLSPSATPKLLNSDFNALKRAGVRRISLSLDGAAADVLASEGFLSASMARPPKATMPFEGCPGPGAGPCEPLVRRRMQAWSFRSIRPFLTPTLISSMSSVRSWRT